MIRHLRLLPLALLAIATSVQAGAIAGHDYAVLDVPQRQEVNDRIEVIEFFSWGCPHCYEFSPQLERWTAALPKDAAFRRVPVSLGHPEWEALVKAYYALQSTGDLARLDSQIFAAIHKDHVSMLTEQGITAWVAKHGVKAATFTAAYRSFGVNTSVGRAQDMAMNYRIDGVPTLAIAGRYTVTGDRPKMLTTATELIAKARGLDHKGDK